MRVVGAGIALPAAAGTVRRWVRAVLAAEGVSDAVISLTFLPPARMRRLKAAVLGGEGDTDVVAYALFHLGRAAGDIYICPGAVRRNARAAGVPIGEEIRRVVVHGVLHVLNHDHPAGHDRVRSPMWRRQERYVRALGGPRR